MTLSELLDRPALIVLIGALASFVLCFATTWIYIAIGNIRVFKILFHMEKLGHKRSLNGWWTRKRMIEILKTADGMPTLGSPKIDATMQKLREQVDSPMFRWLLAGQFLAFVAIAVCMAIISGRIIIIPLALLPATIVFLVFNFAIKATNKSWRCSWRCKEV